MNLESISSKLVRELDGLELSFSEQLSKLKILEQQTLSNISIMRKTFQLDLDKGDNLSQTIDLLAQLSNVIEQMKNVSTPELEDIEYENIDGVSNEDVL